MVWPSINFTVVKRSESPKSFLHGQVQLSGGFSVFASDDNECRLELEGRPYFLCRYFNETSLPWRLGTLSKILSISETKVFTSTEFKNISTHLSPFFPLSPPLVWICILYGMWPGQQKKVGVAAEQKFESIPRFSDFRSITVRNKHRYREDETSFISWLDSW